MEASRRAKIEKSTSSSVKCEGFSLFSSIAMAWCIMNSCHKVVRLIRNTTLMLCSNCAKQFVRKAQNCEKTNHGFCNHDNAPAHTSMLVCEFLAKYKTVIMSQLPYSTLADFSLFPKLKAPLKGKHFATIVELKEKLKEELLACCFKD